METSKRIIALWLPRFGTDRLTRRGAPFAEWRWRPFATVVRQRGALVVAAVTPMAAVAGVRPGQPLADGRALCPDLKTAEADPPAEQAALGGLARWCGRWSPWTAPDGLGEDGGAGLWIDASGCAHLFGGEAALLSDITARLTAAGFATLAAIADTPAAAWAAARFATGSGATVIVPEGASRQWLSALPVAGLRLPPAVADGLNRLGLRRIGDLLAMPRGPLAARFGQGVPHRLDQLTGALPEPINPLRPPPPYHARLAFAEPIGRSEDVAAGLRHLLARLEETLERDGKGARRLELTLYRVDGTAAEAGIGTVRPSRDSPHLARLFAERLDGLDAGFGIEAMSLEVPRAEPLSAEQAAFTRAPGGTELALLVDRLGHRLGADGVLRQTPRPRHWPERSVAVAAPLGPLPRPVASPPSPRPVRLLRRPEAVEAQTSADAPTRFRWRGQDHPLARAEGPERIAAEWWHEATLPPASALRDYWRVEDAGGRRFWLFQARLGWFLHGMFG